MNNTVEMGNIWFAAVEMEEVKRDFWWIPSEALAVHTGSRPPVPMESFLSYRPAKGIMHIHFNIYCFHAEQFIYISS